MPPQRFTPLGPKISAAMTPVRMIFWVITLMSAVLMGLSWQIRRISHGVSQEKI